MAEMVASAATGVMGTVIGKLAGMLTEKYKLAKDVEHGIRFLLGELSSMDAVLQKLTKMDDDQIDPLAKDWRSKVRELSYDIEDCVDRFVLNHSHGGSKANFVRKTMRKVKTLFKDGEIAEQIQELKILVNEQSEQRKRYNDFNQCLAASPQPVLLDPRAPALFQEARDLVGIDGPREEIIRLLKCEDTKEDKVVSIYGIGGQGKTTLAMEVYHNIIEAFDCWAFVSVSQTPDMKRLLRDILSQISKSDFDMSERLETDHQLVRTVRQCLEDKRYFILIDDIWSVEAWNHVRSALPVNDNGSRIITTTRNKVVAESCSTGIVEQMYEAKPLSDDDSKRLFFKRIFLHSEQDCPQDLKKVSSDILRKCGGLPLAVISMAGLLATRRSQTVEAWVHVLRSISDAVDNDSPIDKMKRILLLSYFDLPHHLKRCLLYLSVFPEDYLIDCRQLVLLWVAEGLIPGQDRECMEELGRSYLNELINRSLVEPTKVGFDGTTVKQCRVHDVILEFIMSKAVEDNFVTIWNGGRFSQNYPSNKIRRLSIQEDSSSQVEEIAKAIKKGAHIRSITIFGDNSVLVKKHASEFLSSQVLRVLNITEVSVGCCLGRVKSYRQLKYLELDCGWEDSKLPEDIEKLQHLQTLNVRFARLKKVPTCFMQLHKLVRLFVSETVQLPDGIENLHALEELSGINFGYQSTKVIQGLSDLTKLRLLRIYWDYEFVAGDLEGHKKGCISTLYKLLPGLRKLVISIGPCIVPFMYSDTHSLNSMRPPISSLVNLTCLKICVSGEASKEGINTLASLPMLLSLTVFIPYDKEDGDSSIVYARNAIKGQGFQLLVKFEFRCFGVAALEFELGAMPKLERLKLELPARCQFKYGEGGLVLGLQNLAGLKQVDVKVWCDEAVADEVEALEDDIRVAADAHPNSPMLQIKREDQYRMAQGCSRRPSGDAIQY